MKIRSLLITFVVIVCLMMCSKTSFALKCMSLKDFLHNDDNEIPLDMSTESLSVEELLNRLPDYIKNILSYNELVPYEYNNIKQGKNNSFVKGVYRDVPYQVLSIECACFSERICVSYATKREFSTNNLIVYYSLDFYKKYHPMAYFKLFKRRKSAEVYFSAATGKMTLFKINADNQWFTVYDIKKQNKI
jgi:hypothetical protein